MYSYYLIWNGMSFTLASFPKQWSLTLLWCSMYRKIASVSSGFLKRNQMFYWKSQNGDTLASNIVLLLEKLIFVGFFPLAFAPHIVCSVSFSRRTDFTKHHLEKLCSSQQFTGSNLSLSFPVLNTCDRRAHLTQNWPRVFMCCDLSRASSSLSIRLLPWTTAALFTRIVMSPTCKKNKWLVTTNISPQETAVTVISEYLLLPKYIYIFIVFHILTYRPCNHSGSLKTGS